MFSDWSSFITRPPLPLNIQYLLSSPRPPGLWTIHVLHFSCLPCLQFPLKIKCFGWRWLVHIPVLFLSWDPIVTAVFMMHYLLQYNRAGVVTDGCFQPGFWPTGGGWECGAVKFCWKWSCGGFEALPQVLPSVFPPRLCALRNCQNILQALSGVSCRALGPAVLMAHVFFCSAHLILVENGWLVLTWASLNMMSWKTLGVSICGEFFVQVLTECYVDKYILPLTSPCARSLNRKTAYSLSLDCFSLLALYFLFSVGIGLTTVLSCLRLGNMLIKRIIILYLCLWRSL